MTTGGDGPHLGRPGRKPQAAERDGARQRKWLLILVALYALAALVYVLMPGGGLAMVDAVEGAGLDIPTWQLALSNVALILLLYGPLGLAGLWLAGKAGLPGVYRPGAGFRALVRRPMEAGISLGIVLVLSDTLARASSDLEGFPHPPFPASLLASFSAAVGEEILFRLVVMSLWSVILIWLFRRFGAEASARSWALWVANVIGALAFAAAHLGTALAVTGGSSLAAIPPVMLAEIIVLNSAVGVVAGISFMRNGLVAAAGVHFWADVVWHVLFGALSGVM
jgi:membrane protease YdiL (CAAX protease family)